MTPHDNQRLSPQEKLKEIEESLNGVTPGPWYSWPDDTDATSIAQEPYREANYDLHLYPQSDKEVLGCSEWMRVEQIDIEFMANARSNIPWLIARVKQLEKVLEVIAQDFGTDYCDGNCVRAKEALEKLK